MPTDTFTISNTEDVSTRVPRSTPPGWCLELLDVLVQQCPFAWRQELNIVSQCDLKGRG